jgi:CRP/FNR family transcriptional regulator, cyclic AMP receptor protein
MKDANLFRELSESEVDSILQMMPVFSYSRGEHVYFAWDKGDYLFLVRRGSIKLYYVTESGQEKILGVFQAGEIFGELFLGKYKYRMGHAQALTRVTVYRADQEVFLHLIQKVPRLALNLVEYLAEKRRDALIRIHALLQKEPRNCLLITLHSVLLQQAAADLEAVTVPRALTQQDLANITGLNRTTVSALINQLRREGILGGRGRTLIINTKPFLRAVYDLGLAHPQ